MLQVILQMQDTQEHYEEEIHIYRSKMSTFSPSKAHIYIPLHPQKLVMHAINWLGKYPWMQEVCEIMQCNNVSVMHFDAHTSHHHIGVYLQNDYVSGKHKFSLNFGEDMGHDAAVEFAKILDNSFPDTKDANVDWGDFELHHGNMLSFHKKFPVHVTEDTDALLNELIHPDEAATLRAYIKSLEETIGKHACTIMQLTDDYSKLQGDVTQYHHQDSSESM